VSGVEIGWLPADRLPELQRFIDDEWRRGHVLARDESLLRWQHARRDDPERLAVLVVEEEGRLLGMLGFVEFDTCVGEERVPGGWMTNWLIVPDARGRRLGLELVEAALGSQYEFIGALAANSATEHILGRYGFEAREMHRWVRVYDVDALRELLAGKPYPDEAWQAWACGQTERLSTESGSEPQTSTMSVPAVAACRDAAFLQWRYERHPSFRYELLRDSSGFAAYRVEGVRDSSLKVMRIVDFLGGPALSAELAQAAQAAGVVFADFSCTSARFGAALEETGFQREDRLPAELPGRFQPLDFSDRPIVSCFWAAPRLAVDLGGDDVYVTRADSDLDRPS
jgi:RimJ/RimL family protein N-acetyltransferase